MRDDNGSSFFNGICVSFVLHLLLAALAIVVLERNAATALQGGEIFTVTLEGGEQLGGIAQVPKEGQNKVLTKPEEVKNELQEKEEKSDQEKDLKKHKEIETTKEEYHLDQPAVVDDPQKLIEQKKLEEEKKLTEKKLKEEEQKKKKLEEDKKKKEQEDKKKEEEDKKKQEEEKKKKEEEKIKSKEQEAADKKKEKEKRDKQLADTLKKLKNQYEGESADAGGQGFGAAAVGGKAMGGGTLASLEKVAYSNALQKHVKSGWHWLGGSERLGAKVKAHILPSGEVQNVEITKSSGNSNFDDSVVRAVLKASPVPPAPESIYPDFAVVIFTFDSTE